MTFLKYPAIELLNKTNGPNVVKILDENNQSHGVPCNKRLDNARCLTGDRTQNFCKRNIINIQ